MTENLITGNAAIAQGALDAGLEVITGYPGSPATTVLENVLERRGGREIYAEWSANEKVAFEVATGASIAGARAMVCMKSVGLNVGLDPLTNLNLTGCNGGFVLLLGDDPGGWGSQNEQDGRLLAAFTEIPILEPSDPQEGYRMARYAFELSEEHAIPVMIRTTRKYSTATGKVDFAASRPAGERKRYHRPENGWISVPQYIIGLHQELRRKNLAVAEQFESAPFNQADIRGGFGLICSGHAFAKARKALDSISPATVSMLKLGTTNPLPEKTIQAYLSEVPEVLVCEDNHPFIEKGVRELANRFGLSAGIYGRMTDHLPWPGELSEIVIRGAVSRFMGMTPPDDAGETEAWEYGTLKPYPPGCPNINIFDSLRDAVNELDMAQPVFVGDSGCGVRSMSLSYKTLDVKLCMGSSVGVAWGMVKGGINRRVVALVGDSSFFHTSLSSILNAIHHEADIMIVILYNHSTATTGQQPHPGTAQTASGSDGQRISMEAVLGAAGARHIRRVSTRKAGELKEAFKEGLAMSGLTVVIADGPCPMLDQD
jgi:indolepyruvate ferredoxin oxidoreductase alpha subunit